MINFMVYFHMCFPRSFVVDATPISVVSTVLTSTFVVVMWSLPSLAEDSSIVVSYNVTVAIPGSNISVVQTSTRSVFLADGLTGGSVVNVTVTAIYDMPMDVVTEAAPRSFTLLQAGDSEWVGGGERGGKRGKRERGEGDGLWVYEKHSCYVFMYFGV